MITLPKKNNAFAPRSIWRNPWHFIACGFGVGAIPFAPGTFATIAGLPIYFVLIQFPLWVYIGVTALLVLAGIWLCGKFNHDIGEDDHPAAVWDELASILIVFIAVPPTWYYLAIGVVLFRIFDILKPGPIGWLDKNVHGGLGVMLDDVAAALAAWLILQAIIIFLA